MLRCMSPEMALFCRANRAERCRLSGVDRPTYAQCEFFGFFYSDIGPHAAKRRQLDSERFQVCPKDRLTRHRQAPDASNRLRPAVPS